MGDMSPEMIRKLTFGNAAKDKNAGSDALD
jgi:hypothetical protein